MTDSKQLFSGSQHVTEEITKATPWVATKFFTKLNEVFFPSQIFTLQQKKPKHVGKDIVMQHFLRITALTASHVGVEGLYTYIHMALCTHFQK